MLPLRPSITVPLKVIVFEVDLSRFNSKSVESTFNFNEGLPCTSIDSVNVAIAVTVSPALKAFFPSDIEIWSTLGETASTFICFPFKTFDDNKVFRCTFSPSFNAAQF